ncbi:scavenger receptor cysteine-rich type 1 protein M130-like [Perca fluviatilis]|uniref:scavenger receptor cysteine-rich type 1 protein M130-like n=1 Tax=Perca fluviatilis TaxID=8168 RepID=UPI0019626E5E|nr:scavenger receptor cysteine-rich type 1 protein M130-like [Perca fluviatilis]
MRTKEFQCGGHESALMDCKSSGSDRNTCSSGKAVGLTCTEPVRLVGGLSRCTGSLEVKHQGDWRPVIVSGWTMKVAAVACRELGCPSPVSVERRKESSVRSVWICVQSGSTLRECAESDSYSSILYIICSDPRPFIIRAVVLLLTLLLVNAAFYFYYKASRGQQTDTQEGIELHDYNLGVPAVEGEPTEEEGAQGAE